MPWWAASVGGAAICAVAGWALAAALVLIAQVAQTGQVSGTALRFATQAWLLAHGGVLSSGDTRITLVPLGFTAIAGLAIHGAAGYAGKQARLSARPGFRRGLTVAKVTGTVAGVYAAVVIVAALVTDPGGPALRAGIGAAGLGLVVAFFGSRKTVQWTFQDAWPVWARAVPRAVAVGVLVAVLAGTIALVSGLASHRSQFIALTDQLHPGWVGGIVLVLLQFFYAVNLILWCTAWTFGPGFTVGDGSVVSLVGSQIGLLPVFPVTAALPVGTGGNLWWLVFPVVAGAATALTVLRVRPRARFDETALVGGLAGVVSGLVIAGLAALTRGGLGVDRLADLGPLVVPLLVVAPCIMGLGGMLTGLVLGLVRPGAHVDGRWWSRWKGQAEPADDQPTQRRPAVPLGEPTAPMAEADRPHPADEQPSLDFYADT